MDSVERTDAEHALALFRRMVESVGVKRFASSLDLSTRQVNRILAGVQPNPIDRLLRSLCACSPEVGDQVLDHVCQEMGGYFIREEGSLDHKGLNAVKECAEAIAAISNGRLTPIEEREVREAIASLVALTNTIREVRDRTGNHDGELEINISITEAHQLARRSSGNTNSSR
ncbi:MAG: hypothetical protein Tsb0013_13120 [Phycisphaerales bacterium]